MDVDVAVAVAVEGSNVIGCSATGPFGLSGVSENFEIVSHFGWACQQVMLGLAIIFFFILGGPTNSTSRPEATHAWKVDRVLFMGSLGLGMNVQGCMNE